MTVKELKEILNEFNDDDVFCVYNLENSERFIPNMYDVDFYIKGYFEVNIDENNLC